ncbi:MAG: histidine phosphatase family protein [Oscillospiraceae bacterium]|jgi:alpha-ribazole phosphatase
MTITITLIRSGATQTGLQDRFLGLVDEPLSDQGRDSLIRQAANGMYPEAELVFTSGRSRSLATAHIIYPRTPAIVLRELEPYDYGAFAGKSYRELEEDEAFRRWLASPCLVSPPGGEEPHAFAARCGAAIRQIANETQRKGRQKVAIITHLSVIRSILRRYHLPRPLYWDWQVAFGGGFVTQFDTTRGVLTISEKF